MLTAGFAETSRELEQLIGTLRDELTECGESLALLQEHRSFIIARFSIPRRSGAALIHMELESSLDALLDRVLPVF